jgi:hypothetical protein
MADREKAKFVTPIWSLLVQAAWFGLITGLVEGVSVIILRQADWLFWRMSLRAFWFESLWVSPLINALLFLTLGAALALAGKIIRKLPVQSLGWFIFIFLAVLDPIFILGSG